MPEWVYSNPLTALDSRLHLLLARAGSHESVAAEGFDSEPTGSARLPDKLPKPGELWRTWADPDQLPLQRWGVIAPEGADGDRLIAAIRPLIVRRAEQQGDIPIKEYRVPPVMTLAEAARWKKQHFNPFDDLEDELPRYQLILGDLDRVPLAVQQAQSTDGMVGRIAFDDEQGYEAYVDKVLRWEERSPAADAGDAMLYTVHDRTRAMRVGHSGLMAPGIQMLERWHGRGAVRAAALRACGPKDPSPDDFLRVLKTRRPTVLMTMSHGEGAPAGGWLSVREQRREQGSMSFGKSGRITAEDLARGPVLPGGVWLMFACFGAGTPATSVYEELLETLLAVRQQSPEMLETATESLALGQRPFVSALPKAVLANPDGPLAFIGHVDLAWSYSFLDLDDPPGRPTRRPGRLMSAVQAMLGGARAGVGFRTLSRFLTEVNTELTALYDPNMTDSSNDPAATLRRGHLWMLRHDLAAYVLLGDPAAALPLRRRDAGKPVTPGERVRPVRPADPPMDSRQIARREKAIGMVLSGKFPLQRAAREARIGENELKRLVEAYQRAGRAALSELD